MINRRENTINWLTVPDFEPGEFSEDPDLYASTHLIYSLQLARNELAKPVYPSPAPGALARLEAADLKSMHYADPAQGILSRAIDFFVEGNPVKNFFVLLGGGHFTRFGIYFDTFYNNKPWVMFHADRKTDINQQGFFWYRDEEGVYRYPLTGDFPAFVEYLHRYRHENYTKRTAGNAV